jgi:hypothetical protein
MKIFLRNKERFNKLMVEYGGMKKLADDAGVTDRTIKNLIYDTGIGSTSANKICTALGKSFKSLFLIKMLAKAS